MALLRGFVLSNILNGNIFRIKVSDTQERVATHQRWPLSRALQYIIVKSSDPTLSRGRELQLLSICADSMVLFLCNACVKYITGHSEKRTTSVHRTDHSSLNSAVLSFVER